MAKDREPTTEEIFTAVFVAAALIGGSASIHEDDPALLIYKGRLLAQAALPKRKREKDEAV